MSAEFLLTALVVVAIPGTGAIYTLGQGLTYGARAAAQAAVACTLGIVPHLLAAVTGLAALLAASPTAFAVLKYLGVAYLVLMAVQTWRDRSDLAATETHEPRASVLQVMRTGVLINLLNPKLTVFFFAFLPQFVPTGEPGYVARMIGLGLVFMVMTFVVFLGYGCLAATFREHVVRRPRAVQWLRRVFAASFLALSVRLALTSQ